MLEHVLYFYLNIKHKRFESFFAQKHVKVRYASKSWMGNDECNWGKLICSSENYYHYIERRIKKVLEWKSPETVATIL